MLFYQLNLQALTTKHSTTVLLLFKSTDWSPGKGVILTTAFILEECRFIRLYLIAFGFNAQEIKIQGFVRLAQDLEAQLTAGWVCSVPYSSREMTAYSEST